MRYFGSTAGTTRRYERELVASEFPSIQVYRKILTPYEMQKAEAGKLFYGNINSNQEGSSNQAQTIALVLMGLVLFHQSYTSHGR